MTNFSQDFITYTPCPSNRNIVTSDGLLTIVGVGIIKISPNFTLENIFHPPQFCTHLVSMTKLSYDLNSKATFFPSHCDFPNKDLGINIGHAKAKNDCASWRHLGYLSPFSLIPQSTRFSYTTKTWAHFLFYS